MRNLCERMRSRAEHADSRSLDAPPGTVRRLDCFEYEDRILFSATPAGGEELVNTDTTGAEALDAHAQQAVAADPSGDFVVAWTSSGGQDGNGTGIFAQRYDAAGNQVGAEYQVNTTILGDQAEAAVAKRADGSFVVAWSGPILDILGITILGEGIYYQRYDAAGNAVGGEQQVALALLGDFSQPSIATNAAGDFVITWTRVGGDGSGDSVFARQFHADGTYDGTLFQVNSTSAGDQSQSSVAFDGAGNFVVTWTSAGQDGSGTGVYGQRFDSGGAALGSEFRVNTTTAGNQSEASVAADGAGNFLVTWSSQNQDGSGYGIYGQRYSAAGAQVGGEFLVNATTAGDQRDSRAAMDASGSFVVAWTSTNQDAAGGTGVYFRQYDASGTAISPETLVNQTVAGSQQNPSLALQSGTSFVVAWSGAGPGDADGVFLQRYVDGPNSAPVNTVPGVQTTVEDTPLVFSSGGGNGITIADSGVGSNPVQVTLTATSGTITLSGVAGLTFAGGDGTGDATMTFSGTLGDVNAALAGLTFTPTLDFAGSATLAISTNDLGFSGTGGAQITASSITINVTPVNDHTPTISSNGGAATANVNVAENTTAVTTVVGLDADLPTPTLGYSISGGDDGALFTIDAVTGVLSFLAAPDYEMPGDFDGDNVYEVIVRASDGTFSATQTISATVTDVFEPVPPPPPPPPAPSGGPSGGGVSGGGSGGQEGGGLLPPIFPSPSPGPGGDLPPTPVPSAPTTPNATTPASSVPLVIGSDAVEPTLLLGDERLGSVDALFMTEESVRSLGARITSNSFDLTTDDGFGASRAENVDWGAAGGRSVKATTMLRAAAGARGAIGVRGAESIATEAAFIPWSAITAELETNEYSTTEYLFVGTAGLTATLTVGYLVWSLQAGSLTSILLSSLPTWRSFDPLPVLEYERRRRRRTLDVDELDGVFDSRKPGPETGGLLGAR
jgi:hypothetical protein